MKLYSLTVLLAAAATVGLVQPGELPAVSPTNPSLTSPVATVVQAQRYTVTGKCVMPDGSSAEKVPVRLTTLARPSAGGAGGSQGVSAGSFDGDNSEPLALQSRGRRGSRVTVVSKTATDASGNFTFRNIEPGSYRIEVGNPATTPWMIKSVRVTDKDLKAGEIKLKEPTGHKDNNNDNGGGRRR